MRVFRSIYLEDGDRFPENLVQLIEIKPTGSYQQWNTPRSSGIKYQYRLHGIFEENNSSTSTKIGDDE